MKVFKRNYESSQQISDEDLINKYFEAQVISYYPIDSVTTLEQERLKLVEELDCTTETYFLNKRYECGHTYPLVISESTFLIPYDDRYSESEAIDDLFDNIPNVHMLFSRFNFNSLDHVEYIVWWNHYIPRKNETTTEEPKQIEQTN